MFPSFVSGYNNFLVIDISYPITGLSSNNTYYYCVRAIDANNNSSGNLNIITVTTACSGDSCFAKQLICRNTYSIILSKKIKQD
ncbi:MAG: hypothetical protein ACR2FN_14945 [Chitinophagaceae bacterium]